MLGKKRIRRTISPEEEAIMVEAYLNGMPSRQAAALCGFTKRALTELLRRRGISVRNFSEARLLYYERNPDLTFDNYRTYKLDDTFLTGLIPRKKPTGSAS
jgi:hypothetical protein